MVGVGFGDFGSRLFVGEGEYAEQIAGQLGVVGANLLRLVEIPLVRGLVLIEHSLGVGAMAKNGGNGHQNGDHAHGEGDRAHGPLAPLFGMFFEFLDFVGFHGGSPAAPDSIAVNASGRINSKWDGREVLKIAISRFKPSSKVGHFVYDLPSLSVSPVAQTTAGS